MTPLTTPEAELAYARAIYGSADHNETWDEATERESRYAGKLTIAQAAALKAARAVLALQATGQPVTLTDAMVDEVMTEAWDEICADTDCHPLDIEQLGRRRLGFKPRHWSSFIAGRLRARLQATAEPRGGEREAVIDKARKAYGSCISAWSCGEPPHRVETMLDDMDAREAWLSPDRGSHPNLVLEEAEAWIGLQAVFDPTSDALASSPPLLESGRGGETSPEAEFAFWADYRLVRDFLDDEESGRLEAGGETTDYLKEAQDAVAAFGRICDPIRAALSAAPSPQSREEGGLCTPERATAEASCPAGGELAAVKALLESPEMREMTRKQFQGAVADGVQLGMKMCVDVIRATARETRMNPAQRDALNGIAIAIGAAIPEAMAHLSSEARPVGDGLGPRSETLPEPSLSALSEVKGEKDTRGSDSESRQRESRSTSDSSPLEGER